MATALLDRDNNLLLRLRNWARRQDENFHTEVLVHLLQHLVRHERAYAGQLLQWLFALPHPPGDSDLASLRLLTQSRYSQGRPDLEFRSEHCTWILEVKVDAGLGDRQAERYAEVLQTASTSSKALAILSCKRLTLATAANARQLLWEELGDKLATHHQSFCHPISSFYIDQFLAFLKLRGLMSSKVTEGLTNGLEDLQALLTLIDEALRLEGHSRFRLERDSEGLGFLLHGDYWIGVGFNRPTTVWASSYNVKVNALAASGLSYGLVEHNNRGSFWWLPIDLESADERFFELSKADQLSRLRRLIREFHDGMSRLGSPAILAPID